MESGRNFITGLAVGMIFAFILAVVMARPTIVQQRAEIARLNKEVQFANTQGEVVTKLFGDVLAKIAENYTNGVPLFKDLPKPVVPER